MGLMYFMRAVIATFFSQKQVEIGIIKPMLNRSKPNVLAARAWAYRAAARSAAGLAWGLAPRRGRGSAIIATQD